MFLIHTPPYVRLDYGLLGQNVWDYRCVLIRGLVCVKACSASMNLVKIKCMETCQQEFGLTYSPFLTFEPDKGQALLFRASHQPMFIVSSHRELCTRASNWMLHMIGSRYSARASGFIIP